MPAAVIAGPRISMSEKEPQNSLQDGEGPENVGVVRQSEFVQQYFGFLYCVEEKRWAKKQIKLRIQILSVRTWKGETDRHSRGQSVRKAAKGIEDCRSQGNFGSGRESNPPTEAVVEPLDALVRFLLSFVFAIGSRWWCCGGCGFRIGQLI